MMMEIRIDVNVRTISWVVDVNEVWLCSFVDCFLLIFFVFTSVEKSCSTPQCFNGGVCVNTIDSFKCICPIDYEGQRCDLSNDKFSIQSKRNKILFFRMERLCKSFVSTWFDVCRWCCIVFMSMFERFYGQILWN